MLTFIFNILHLNKECAAAEIRENGFRFAFGISIIIVGFLSYSYDINNSILIGISISSALFSFVEVFFGGNTLVNAAPLTILLLFCIYPDAPFVKVLSDAKLNNLIVFISFGFAFVFFSLSNYRERCKQFNQQLIDEINYNNIIISQFESAIIISDLNSKIRNVCSKNNYTNQELQDLLSELGKFANEESTLGSIKHELLSSSDYSHPKTSFTIEEVENAIIKSAEYKRNEFNNINESKKARKKK